eukprot:1019860_1
MIHSNMIHSKKLLLSINTLNHLAHTNFAKIQTISKPKHIPPTKMMKTIASLITFCQLSNSQGIPAVPATPALPSFPGGAGNGIALAPPGMVFGAYGQFCAGPAPDTECQSIRTALYSQEPGFTKCEKDYDCCLCSSITCGDANQGCVVFSAGNYGVFGGKSIDIEGRMLGAQINCIGVEACAESQMTGRNVKNVNSAGTMALKNAQISITRPVPGFSLDCVGHDSCDGLQLELVFEGPPPGYACDPSYVETIWLNQISCIQTGSCKNLDVTIRNEGCNKVMIGKLECILPGSCADASFNLIGDVEFHNCDLRSSAGSSATGIETCFDNLQKLLCAHPQSCRSAVRRMWNPKNGFLLTCDNIESCQGAQFTIDIEADVAELITYFEGLKFTGTDSGAGAVITVNNKQTQGTVLNIERIECASMGACTGTTFIIGHDVSVGEITCSTGACDGCMVKIDAAGPGIPCDPNSVAPGAPIDLPPQVPIVAIDLPPQVPITIPV